MKIQPAYTTTAAQVVVVVAMCSLPFTSASISYLDYDDDFQWSSPYDEDDPGYDSGFNSGYEPSLQLSDIYEQQKAKHPDRIVYPLPYEHAVARPESHQQVLHLIDSWFRDGHPHVSSAPPPKEPDQLPWLEDDLSYQDDEGYVMDEYNEVEGREEEGIILPSYDKRMLDPIGAGLMKRGNRLTVADMLDRIAARLHEYETQDMEEQRLTKRMLDPISSRLIKRQEADLALAKRLLDPIMWGMINQQLEKRMLDPIGSRLIKRLSSKRMFDPIGSRLIKKALAKRMLDPIGSRLIKRQQEKRMLDPISSHLMKRNPFRGMRRVMSSRQRPRHYRIPSVVVKRDDGTTGGEKTEGPEEGKEEQVKRTVEENDISPKHASKAGVDRSFYNYLMTNYKPN